MKIQKINSDKIEELEVVSVRLPRDDDGLMNTECGYISSKSPLYNNGTLEYAFFCEVENEEDDEDFEGGVGVSFYGNYVDSGYIIDLVPVIEIRGKVEKGVHYLVNGLPFVAFSEKLLICETRINYLIAPEYGEIDYDAMLDFIDESIESFSQGI